MPGADFRRLLHAAGAVLLFPLDEPSAPIRNRGSHSATITERGTPTYGVPARPIGRGANCTSGAWTMNTGAAVGRVSYTVGAWVRTTDAGTTVGYAGNARNNAMGDWAGAIKRGFGVHGGKVRHCRYIGSWHYTDGGSDVADGKLHLIGASAKSDSTVEVARW